MESASASGAPSQKAWGAPPGAGRTSNRRRPGAPSHPGEERECALGSEASEPEVAPPPGRAEAAEERLLRRLQPGVARRELRDRGQKHERRRHETTSAVASTGAGFRARQRAMPRSTASIR